MRPVERVLLYACAFALGWMLLFDLTEHAKSQEGAETRQRDDRSRASIREAPRSFAELQEPVRSQAAEPNGLPDPAGTFVLRDAKGRPRIEFVVDQAGTAKIVLMSELGEPVVSLTAGASGAGHVVVENDGNRAETFVTEKGDLQFTLTSGNDNAAALTMSVQKDGEMALRLSSAKSAEAYLGVSKAGTAEIGVVDDDHGLGAFLRTNGEGAAEIAVEDKKKQRLSSMALLANGDADFRLTGTDGKVHAVMQVLDDGLAEIGIRTTDALSGPHMLRLPTGVSIVASRLPNGRPGASLVSSPGGVSVVAVHSQDGKHQASLRMDAKNRADLLFPEPTDPKQKQKPMPKPKPKQPKPLLTLNNSTTKSLSGNVPRFFQVYAAIR